MGQAGSCLLHTLVPLTIYTIAVFVIAGPVALMSWIMKHTLLLLSCSTRCRLSRSSNELPCLAADLVSALCMDLPVGSEAASVVVPVGLRTYPDNAPDHVVTVGCHVLAQEPYASRVYKEPRRGFCCEGVEEARSMYNAVLHHGQVRVGAGLDFDADHV